jgi:hypothetical protein
MQKGVGFRVNLEVYDTTGIAVSGSHAVTAAISQNGSGYVTSTNTPVTASATYPQMVSFMLTDAEANADSLHIIGGSLNCVIPPRTFYPEAVYTTSLTGVISTNLDTTVSSRASATGVTVSSITSGVLFSIASELLTVDWNDITDTVAARSVLNALRALRNKISISGTTLTICEEDDVTPAWTATGVEAPGATPFSEIDPA